MADASQLLFSEVRQLIDAAKQRAAAAVNRELMGDRPTAGS